ncbi:MAG TPA: hypothetical protein VMV49_07725 [Candidatus Deferrimicrobium sp.]|nr:hypothetical protein [Candidatus Deferrimicrobium sp.]
MDKKILKVGEIVKAEWRLSQPQSFIYITNRRFLYLESGQVSFEYHLQGANIELGRRRDYYEINGKRFFEPKC